MVKKVVASLVVAGSIAAGSAGVAAAAPAPHCTNAPARIAQLQAQESGVASALTALEARAAHGGRGAFRLHRDIALLTREEARLTAQVSALQARCPGTGTSNSGPSTTTTTTSGVVVSAS
jgi:hypothetical protein